MPVLCSAASSMFQLRTTKEMARSKKTVLEKKIPFLETIKGKKNRKIKVQREISIHSIKQTVDMYTHKYICRRIYFPDSTKFAVSWQLNSCFFFVFLPSLFTLFCLVKTLIIFLGILMSPLLSNTTEIICPGTQYIRHRGTHH